MIFGLQNLFFRDSIHILGVFGPDSPIFSDFLENSFFDPSMGPKIGQKSSFWVKNDDFWPILGPREGSKNEFSKKSIKIGELGPNTPNMWI